LGGLGYREHYLFACHRLLLACFCLFGVFWLFVFSYVPSAPLELIGELFIHTTLSQVFVTSEKIQIKAKTKGFLDP